MKKLGIVLTIACMFLGRANAEGFFQGSINMTPTVYKVPIRRVDFRNAETLEWVTLADVAEFNNDEDVIMDIASVDAGAVIGTFGEGNVLPDGQYDQMRFIIESVMTTKGAIFDPDRNKIVWLAADTDTEEVTDSFSGFTYLVNLAESEDGTIGDLAAKLEAITEAALASPITDDALSNDMIVETINGKTYFDGTMPLVADGVDASFVVVAGDMPLIQLNFDVTDRLEFYYDSDLDEYVVTLQGPNVTITVDGITVTSRSGEGE